MLALLILPVLVAGFLFCHIHPYYRLKLHRYEGQYLYLVCAFNGLKCFGLALILAYVGHFYIPDFGNDLFGNPSNQKLAEHIKGAVVIAFPDPVESLKIGWFLLISALTFFSVFLIVALQYAKNYWHYRKIQPDAELTGEILEDSPLDYLLFNLSLNKNKSVMLTMDDRKVYVGMIVSLGEPSETLGMNKDILLVPLMSGYRDKDTLKVEFTTKYVDGRHGIEICLRQESIVSATEFDFDAYGRWNSLNNKTHPWQ